MFSVFKIFNPKNWRKGKVLGRLGGILKSVPRKTKNAWKSFSKFARKNKAWFLTIGGAVASTFIVKGLSNLFAKAEEQEELRTRKYPNMSDAAISARLIREYSQKVSEHANALRYATESDSNHVHQHLAGLIQAYHGLLHAWSDPDNIDFAVTTDRYLGGAANVGVSMEDDATAAFVVSKFRIEKDDEHPESISEDLMYLISLDQMNLPLKMSI